MDDLAGDEDDGVEKVESKVWDWMERDVRFDRNGRGGGRYQATRQKSRDVEP